MPSERWGFQINNRQNDLVPRLGLIVLFLESLMKERIDAEATVVDENIYPLRNAGLE